VAHDRKYVPTHELKNQLTVILGFSVKRAKIVQNLSFLLFCFRVECGLCIWGRDRHRCLSRSSGVNFINVLRAHFSYESSFKAKTYLEKRLSYVKFAGLTLMKLTTVRIDEVA